VNTKPWSKIMFFASEEYPETFYPLSGQKEKKFLID
jgi:hypothetical protein